MFTNTPLQAYYLAGLYEGEAVQPVTTICPASLSVAECFAWTCGFNIGHALIRSAKRR
jgi:hypothetical protein